MQYTESLEYQAEDFVIDFDNQEESLKKLERVKKNFRPFGESLASFLMEQNFVSSKDPAILESFLKQKFLAEGIKLPRSIRKWFSGPAKIERETSFQICFALKLDLETTNLFFKKVCLERGFNCKDPTEAIYYYCFLKRLSYTEARGLVSEIKPVLDNKKQNLPMEETEVAYTKNIINDLESIPDPEALIRYIRENARNFCYNHVMATEIIRELLDQITNAETGLLFRDPYARSGLKRNSQAEKISDWDALLLILGLQEELLTEKDRKERNIHPLLDRLPLPESATAGFPDRDCLQKIRNGNPGISDQRIRKTLILLKFYQFWCKQIGANYYDYHAILITKNEYRSEADDFLSAAGFEPLYFGDPYDWIFLWASCSGENPLQNLRDLFGSAL